MTPPLTALARRRRSATPFPRRSAVVALAAVAALAACDPYVQGNGVFHKEDRSAGLAPFAGIQVEDGIRAIVTETAASGGAQTVVVEGDANVVRWIKTEVHEETVDGVQTPVLHVRVDGSDFASTNPLRAVIGMQGLRFIRAVEGARVETSFASAAHFVVAAVTAADVTLRGPGYVDPVNGTRGTLRATLEGAFVHATAYPVSHAEVKLAGGSRLELRAEIAAGEADATSRVENVGGVCEISGTAALVCCATPGCV